MRSSSLFADESDKIAQQFGVASDGRLNQAAMSIAPHELGAHWYHQTIIVRIQRPEYMDPAPDVLPRVRGAWGRRLMAGASSESLAGHPCSFTPPCALDIFMREQFRTDGGRHGLPKPYVFALDCSRRHIDVQLTIFGLACEWLPAAREALVAALAHDVRYSPKTVGANVDGCGVSTVTAIDIGAGDVGAAVMDFSTPFDTTGTSFLDEPSTLIARLARRIDGLCTWMELAIDTDWSELADVWRDLQFGMSDIMLSNSERGSSRQNRRFRNPVASGRILIEGNLNPVWPFLVLGQACHVGRGADAGLGRYSLST